MTENTHNPQVGEKATRLQRLTQHWVYGGVPLSCLLLVLILSFQNHLSWLQFLLALHLQGASTLSGGEVESGREDL